MVGGELMNLIEHSNEPHHLRLGEGPYAGHAGTVMNGILANELFIEPFNKAYDLGIEPLSDEELLRNAGIPPTENAADGDS